VQQQGELLINEGGDHVFADRTHVDAITTAERLHDAVDDAGRLERT
jgi:hypothetical protein